jgi:hypothetical protein
MSPPIKNPDQPSVTTFTLPTVLRPAHSLKAPTKEFSWSDARLVTLDFPATLSRVLSSVRYSLKDGCF